MTVLDVSRDIKGALYKALLFELAQRSEVAGLVVRNPHYLSSESKGFLNRLSEDLVSGDLRESWPGTKLVGYKVPVHEYKITRTLIKKLSAFGTSLFFWGADEVPQDLYLRRGDVTILETVGHERWGYIRVDSLTPLLSQLIEGRMLQVL